MRHTPAPSQIYNTTKLTFPRRECREAKILPMVLMIKNDVKSAAKK